jgi:hypothetical protein
MASMNLDGTGLQVVDLSYPDLTLDPLPELGENESIAPSFQNFIDVGGDRPQALWAIYHLDNAAPTFYALHSEYRLSEIAEDGSITAGIRLDVEPPEGYSLSFLGWTEGSIWFEYKGYDNFEVPWHLMGFSTADGSMLADITLPELTTVYTIGAMDGGRLMVQTNTVEPMENGYGFQQGSEKFYLLDPAAGRLTLKEPLTIPSSLVNGTIELVDQPLHALSPQAVLWCNDGLFLWDTETNTLSKKYDWLAFGGSAYTMEYASMYFSDGRYIYRDQRDSRKAMKLNTIATIEEKELDPDEMVEVCGEQIMLSYKNAKAYTMDGNEIANCNDLPALPTEAVKALLIARSENALN